MSSSSVTSTTTVNGTTRITGLSSGLDVDSIVEQLMTAEKAKKLNKLQQNEQKTEWTQTAYRDIIADVQSFSQKYFNTTSASNLLSSSNFVQYAAASTDESAVTAAAASSASAGNHTVLVSQLATAATLGSNGSISKAVQGTATPAYSSLSSKSFSITLDGTKRTVSLTDVTDLASLQTALDDTVGTGKVTVSADSTTGYLTIVSANSGVQEISISAPDSGTSGLSALGFGSSAVLSNRLDTSDTLSDIAAQLSSSTALQFNADGQIELSINGTALIFDKDDTLAETIAKVNKSNASVTMKYDEVSGELSLTANSTGAGNTLTTSESGTSNLLTVLLSDYTAGVDAKATIDAVSYVRSSNQITVDGVTYTANQTTTSAVTVNVTQDTDGVYDLISGFVSDYNTLIDTINTALAENYDSDYPPLTAAQKEDMSDDEITNWETQAKIGLLESDSVLTDFIGDLRTALSDSISGLTGSLAAIGIETGTYDEKGKLNITEETLTAAIADDPEAIMKLFTQQSTAKTAAGKSLSGTANIRTLSAKDLNTRYKEEGIAYRFYDIIQKNISTITDSAGNKSLLLEKAGVAEDSSETDNTLSSLLAQYDSEIDDEQDRLSDYEDKLYAKYSELETYINTMNSKLSALSSYLSSSS